MQKSLDQKLTNILADSSCKDFILADAKDADMAGGMAAPGKSPEHHAHEGRFRTLDDYRELIRRNVKQGLVDIMLMSASSNEVLTINERIFDGSHITPAIRANDTTDIWLAQGGVYPSEASRPFRTATIDHGMCGGMACDPTQRRRGADLGLYSITFNNHLELDYEALQQYKAFREEAEKKGFRHFLEIFDPNACADRCPPDLGRYINDMIARTLAGVTSKARPIFFKIAYHGPAQLEQLVAYDSSFVVGILGGSSGTTFDAFHQLWEAKKYGAKAALYGRMINNSEDQHTFIQHLRWLADGEIDDPAEAVKSYHASLEKLGVRPYRELSEDLQATLRGTAYGSSATPGKPSNAAPVSDSKPSAGAGAEPDFATMTAAEKIKWNLERLNRVLG